MVGSLSEAPQQGQGEPHSHSGLIRHITPAFAKDAAALLEAGAAYFFQIRSVGGAVSDVPADATAYGWRDANFSVVAFGSRSSGLDPWWEKLIPHMEGMYFSFESATGPEVLARAFPPSTSPGSERSNDATTPRDCSATTSSSTQRPLKAPTTAPSMAPPDWSTAADGIPNVLDCAIGAL